MKLVKQVMLKLNPFLVIGLVLFGAILLLTSGWITDERQFDAFLPFGVCMAMLFCGLGELKYRQKALGWIFIVGFVLNAIILINSLLQSRT